MKPKPVMPKEQDDGLRLVRAVKKHPCLYNYNLKEYTQRESIEDAWRKIANELKGDPKKLRDRWRNYRTVFLRRSKKDPKNNYYLNEDMSFLLDFVKVTVPLPSATRSSSSLPASAEPCDLERALDDDGTDEVKVLEYDFNDHSGIFQTNSSTTSVKNSSHQQVAQYMELPVHSTPAAATTTPTQPSAATENTRKLFFMSISPELEKMTDKQFRGLRKLVLDYLDECEDTIYN